MFFLQHKVIKKTQAQTAPGTYDINAAVFSNYFKYKKYAMFIDLAGAGGGAAAGTYPADYGGKGGDGELLSLDSVFIPYPASCEILVGVGGAGSPGLAYGAGGSYNGENGVAGGGSAPFSQGGGGGGGASYIDMDGTKTHIARGGGGGGGMGGQSQAGGVGGNGGGQSSGSGGAGGSGAAIHPGGGGVGQDGGGYTGGGAGGAYGTVSHYAGYPGTDGSFSADIYIYL
jgi:hypothetical protein